MGNDIAGGSGYQYFCNAPATSVIWDTSWQKALRRLICHAPNVAVSRYSLPNFSVIRGLEE